MADSVDSLVVTKGGMTAWYAEECHDDRKCWQALRMGAIMLAICACSPSAAPRKMAKPESREIVITTVPLLTKEIAKIYPFPATDFRKGGVLATTGVMIGTAVGSRVLPVLGEKTFRRSVAILLAVLGLTMIGAAFRIDLG